MGNHLLKEFYLIQDNRLMHRCPSFRTSFRRVQCLRHARRRRPTVASSRCRPDIISKTEIIAGVEHGKLYDMETRSVKRR